MGQSPTKEEPAVVSPPQRNVFNPKRYMNKLEVISMRCVFDDIKTTNADCECIELAQFLEYLKLPSELEPSAVLLFKSFSYLGSYPSFEAPVPLTFHALVTAYVIISGRLDSEKGITADSIFFESLSILPPHHEVSTEGAADTQEKEPTLRRESTGFSLAELGINFDDMRLEEDDVEDKDDMQILSRDIISIFSLFIWLGNTEYTNFSLIKEAAESIARLQSNSTDTIHFSRLKSWMVDFAPHFFHPIQSFITKTFTYYPTPDDSNRLLADDNFALPDDTDILTPIYTTFLNWALPENVSKSKSWTRLYSATEDGFSMNRYESHVFKYPGPTLLVVQAEGLSNLVLAAYIPQPWKQSKSQYWGDSSCFLYELHPDLDIFRPIHRKHLEVNHHYIYYHHAYGIGLGGNQHNMPSSSEYEFNLFIENNLQRGKYSHEAYASFPTLESSTRPERSFCHHFDIVNVEVFGLGGDKEKELQAKEWRFEYQEAARRAGLNIRTTDGELDKELLKMAGIIDMDSRQDR